MDHLANVTIAKFVVADVVQDMDLVLAEHFEVIWSDTIARIEGRRGVGRNKLRTYHKFKTVFTTEQYVKTVMSTARRGALAKFRSGTAPIRLETGRFENIPENERLCILCDAQVTENEQHTLICCHAFENIRTDAFNEFESLLPGVMYMSNELKLHAILSKDILVRPAAKFCQDVLEQGPRQIAFERLGTHDASKFVILALANKLVYRYGKICLETILFSCLCEPTREFRLVLEYMPEYNWPLTLAN